MEQFADGNKYSYDLELIENFIKKEESDDVLVLRVQLYSANLEKAIPFRDYLMNLIKDKWLKIVIDLSEVEYIDSTFLGSMVFVLKKLKAQEGDLLLVFGQKSKASTMFEVTNMDKVFSVFETIEAAKKSFK